MEESNGWIIFLSVYSIGITFALMMLLKVSACRIHKEISKRFDDEPGFAERVDIAAMVDQQIAKHKIAHSTLGVISALATLNALKWPEGKPRMNEVSGKEG